jgi:predicted DCC family thiol-disulfide oxidoreductase YuxK
METLRKTEVYFDGACHLCSREITHYRKLDRANQIRFVDIAQSSFSATNEHLDPIAVNQKMHVRDTDGKLHTGVDAFLKLWEVLPGFENWIKVAKLPGMNPLLHVGYAVFARLRVYLPKRKPDACDFRS